MIMLKSRILKGALALSVLVTGFLGACTDEKQEPKVPVCYTQSIKSPDGKNQIVWRYDTENRPTARIGYDMATGARTDCTLISYTSSPAFINFTVFDNGGTTLRSMGATMGAFGPTRRIEQYNSNGNSVTDTIVSGYNEIGQLITETISRRTLTGGTPTISKLYFRYTWSGGNVVTRSYSGPEIRRFPATYPDGFTYQTYEYWPQNGNATDTFSLFRIKNRNLLKRVLGDASVNNLTTEYTYRFDGQNKLLGGTVLQFLDRTRPVKTYSFNFNKSCF